MVSLFLVRLFAKEIKIYNKSNFFYRKFFPCVPTQILSLCANKKRNYSVQFLFAGRFLSIGAFEHLQEPYVVLAEETQVLYLIL